MRAMQMQRGKTGNMQVEGYRRGAIALVDQGVVSVTSFATALLIGRHCGKADLGLYTLAWTLLSVSAELSGALITTPYTVFSPRLSRGRRRRYLGSMAVHQVAWMLLFTAALGLALAAGYATGRLSRRLVTLFAASAVALLLIGLKEFVRRVSFAQLRVGSACAMDAAASVLQLAGMAELLRAGSFSVAHTLLLMGLSSGLAAGAWLWHFRREIRFQPRRLYVDLAGNWMFARWVLGSGVLSAAARYIFPWMLAACQGSAATGLWASCMSLAAICNPLVIGMSNYALPRIATVYAQAGRRALRRKTASFCALFALSLLPWALGLSLAGDRLVTRVYGPAFTGTSVILALLSWNMWVNATLNPCSQGLFTLNRAKQDTAINGLWVGLLFTAGIFAVRSYSALGAATALLASSVLTAAVRALCFWNAAEPGAVHAGLRADALRPASSAAPRRVPQSRPPAPAHYPEQA